MRRVLGGLLVACVVVMPVSPAAADQLDKAKSTQQALQRELDAATFELATLENDQFWAEQDLAAMQRQLAQAKAQLAAAQRILGDRAASIYQTGSASLLSSLLASDATQVIDRAEFVTMLATRQADLVTEAKTAAATYSQTVRQVAHAKARSKDLRQRQQAMVARITDRLEAARRLVDKLSGFSPTTIVGGRLIACPVSRPYSYIDTWGAARSGGRSHQGTDIMNPYGKLMEKAGNTRDGGAFWDRMGNIAVWNSVMDEDRYLTRRWNEFITS